MGWGSNESRTVASSYCVEVGWPHQGAKNHGVQRCEGEAVHAQLLVKNAMVKGHGLLLGKNAYSYIERSYRACGFATTGSYGCGLQTEGVPLSLAPPSRLSP